MSDSSCTFARSVSFPLTKSVQRHFVSGSSSNLGLEKRLRSVEQGFKQSAPIWIGFAALVFLLKSFFSDGGFSAILTLSSGFNCFSYLLLFFHLNRPSRSRAQKSTHSHYMGDFLPPSISLQSVECCGLVLILRLSSTLFFNGYLPVDRSGDWIYQAIDVFTVGIIVVISLRLRLSGEYKLAAEMSDRPDRNFIRNRWIVLIGGCIALLVRPSLNNHRLADWAWSTALYIESLAMLPQVVRLSTIQGEVEALCSNHVASIAISRVLAFLFWYQSFNELKPRRYEGPNIAGWAVLTAYAIQLIIVSDFCWQYVLSCWRKTNLLLT